MYIHRISIYVCVYIYIYIFHSRDAPRKKLPVPFSIVEKFARAGQICFVVPRTPDVAPRRLEYAPTVTLAECILVEEVERHHSFFSLRCRSIVVVM